MWEWCRNQQEKEEEEDEEELRGAKTALRCEEYPQFRVEFCPQDDLGNPPCHAPPGELTAWDWSRNQQEEEEEEDEEELRGAKTALRCEEYHNFESSFAPKMI